MYEHELIIILKSDPNLDFDSSSIPFEHLNNAYVEILNGNIPEISLIINMTDVRNGMITAYHMRELLIRKNIEIETVRIAGNVAPNHWNVYSEKIDLFEMLTLYNQKYANIFDKLTE